MRGRIVAAAFAVLATGVPAQAAPAAPACRTLAFSPAFAQDRTMWCAVSAGDGVHVHRSTDGGRSWGHAVRAYAGEGVYAFVVPSPLYAEDRRVLLWTPPGMYESRDGGTTFGAQRVSDTWGMVTPYVDTLGPGTPRAAYVHAIGNTVYDSVTGERPVGGVPARTTLRYVVPQDYAATRRAVVLTMPAASVYVQGRYVIEGARAYLCAGDFTCAEEVFHFEGVLPFSEGDLGRGRQYLLGRGDGAVRAWRSPDSGRTWGRWPSVERLLAGRAGESREWDATVSGDPGSRVLHLTVTTLLKRHRLGDRLSSELWRSDDDGATWRRLPVPWTGPGPLGTWPTVTHAGGRTYAVAGRGGFAGMLCSADRGRTWRTGTCP